MKSRVPVVSAELEKAGRALASMQGQGAEARE